MKKIEKIFDKNSNQWKWYVFSQNLMNGINPSKKQKYIYYICKTKKISKIIFKKS